MLLLFLVLGHFTKDIWKYLKIKKTPLDIFNSNWSDLNRVNDES